MAKLYPNSHIVKKVWGCEQIILTKPFCVKIMYMYPRSRSSIHKHAKRDELFYVLKGPIVFEFAENVRRLSKVVAQEGAIFRIKPGMWHRFTNFGGGVTQFLEVSTHEDPKDTRRASPSRRGF